MAMLTLSTLWRSVRARRDADTSLFDDTAETAQPTQPFRGQTDHAPTTNPAVGDPPAFSPYSTGPALGPAPTASADAGEPMTPDEPVAAAGDLRVRVLGEPETAVHPETVRVIEDIVRINRSVSRAFLQSFGAGELRAYLDHLQLKERRGRTSRWVRPEGVPAIAVHEAE